MKKLFIFLLTFCVYSIFAQEEKNPSRNELDMETNSGKIFQGAFIGGFTYLTVEQFTRNKKSNWLKKPLSIIVPLVYELVLNKATNSQKQLFVVTGALSVNLTIDIFKPRKRLKTTQPEEPIQLEQTQIENN